MEKGWFISHTWSLTCQASVNTFLNIEMISSHQVIYVALCQPIELRCNVILGESASIDVRKCKGETPSIKTNCLRGEDRVTQLQLHRGCLCVLEFACARGRVYAGLGSIKAWFQSQVVSLWISGNADKAMHSRRRAFRRKVKH